MSSVLSAESAVLLHFETVRVVLLVFHGVVVSLLALGASQSDFHAHKRHLLKICLPVSHRLYKDLVSGQLQITTPMLKNGHKK